MKPSTNSCLPSADVVALAQFVVVMSSWWHPASLRGPLTCHDTTCVCVHVCAWHQNLAMRLMHMTNLELITWWCKKKTLTAHRAIRQSSSELLRPSGDSQKCTHIYMLRLVSGSSGSHTASPYSVHMQAGVSELLWWQEPLRLCCSQTFSPFPIIGGSCTSTLKFRTITSLSVFGYH